jgi:GTPase SAR1 family protein
VECLVNNTEYLKLIIWELKATIPHLNLHSSYCSGASAAILTFAFPDRDSFNKLTWWIKLLRRNETQIPIVILGTKSDLPHAVSTEEIQTLVEEFQIADFFEVNSAQDMRETVFKSLLKNMHLFAEIKDFLLVAPTYNKEFKKFLKKFAICPICKKENHENYLKRFFFSLRPDLKKIKDQFFDALSVENDEKSQLNVKFGIPCCDCFTEIFGG